MSRSKDTGTRGETALVRYAIERDLTAERRALAGAADQGDVWIAGGRVVAEVKVRNRPHTDGDAVKWLAECEREVIAALAARAPVAGVDFAMVVVKPPHRGWTSVGDWWALMLPADAAWLLAGVGIHDGDGWVQMRVRQVFDRLPGRLGLPINDERK